MTFRGFLVPPYQFRLCQVLGTSTKVKCISFSHQFPPCFYPLCSSHLGLLSSQRFRLHVKSAFSVKMSLFHVSRTHLNDPLSMNTLPCFVQYCLYVNSIFQQLSSLNQCFNFLSPQQGGQQALTTKENILIIRTVPNEMRRLFTQWFSCYWDMSIGDLLFGLSLIHESLSVVYTDVIN